MTRIVLRKNLVDFGVPFTNTHLLRLEKAGLFPRRVRLGGGNRVGYIQEELENYLKSLADARDRVSAT